jgi:hypothetical protein
MGFFFEARISELFGQSGFGFSAESRDPSFARPIRHITGGSCHWSK